MAGIGEPFPPLKEEREQKAQVLAMKVGTPLIILLISFENQRYLVRRPI